MSHSQNRFLAVMLGLALPLAAVAQDASPVKEANYKERIKLACVGDSITQGVGAAGGMSWPNQIITLDGSLKTR